MLIKLLGVEYHMSNNDKKECFSIGIIGGADGPTTVYVADSESETSANRQWQKVLNACKMVAICL